MRLFPLLALLALACTKSDDEVVDTDLADTDVADTDVADTDDTDVACNVDADLGSPGELVWFGRSDDLVSGNAQAALNDDAAPDAISVEVYAGFGVFADGEPEPGTYDLAGVNYDDCGVCVLLYGDIDPEAGTGTTVWLATAGSVELTRTVDGLAGTLTDLVFEQVEIDPETFHSTPVGTCTASLDELAFAADWVESRCDDGIDDDHDGLTDCDDPDCTCV